MIDNRKRGRGYADGMRRETGERREVKGIITKCIYTNP